MELRETFDTAALAFERFRPGHAPEAFDALATLTGISPPAQVLEIGCGPGQATIPLLEHGYPVHAVEVAPNLAARARARTTSFQNFQVEVGTFEALTLEDASVEMVFSASAFHALDRTVAYPKAHRVLKPGGALALMWSSLSWGEDVKARDVLFGPAYSQWAPELEREREHLHQEVDGIAKELQTSPLFQGFIEQRFSRQLRYDPQGYVNLLGTYSSHIALDPFKRERLFDSIREIIDRASAGKFDLTLVTRLMVAKPRR